MKSPEEKAEILRQQVNSKIRWGARDQEVLDWLAEKQGVTGDEADELLASAHLARRAAVRTKAIIMMATSALGILLAGAYVSLQVFAGVFVIGWGSMVILGIGFASAGIFFRNLWRLLTGQMLGSVD